MDALYDYLKKTIGDISVTKLVKEKKHEVYMIRTDSLRGNPTIKILPAASLLFHKQQTGQLKGIHTIIVCSSGNFAIAMAMMLETGIFGKIKLVAIVPPSIDQKKRERLQRRDVMILEAQSGAFVTADELAKEPGWLHVHQYKDPAMTRGVEIYLAPMVWEQVKFTAAFIPMGTGGTAIGFNAFIKSKGIDAGVIGINLIDGQKVSGMRDYARQREVQLPWSHNIEQLVSVTREESLRGAEELRDEGMGVGTSSGAGKAGFDRWTRLIEKAINWKRHLNAAGKMVVVIPCPDSVYAFE